MVSGKGNWSVNLWLPLCIKSTTAQNLIISNYARGMKKLQIRKVFLAFILLTSSYCSTDPAFVLFSIIGHFVFQIANVLNKLLKIKVHQKEFYSEILLKIVLGKRIILSDKHFNSLKLENFLLQKVFSKVVKYSSSKSSKQNSYQFPLRDSFHFHQNLHFFSIKLFLKVFTGSFHMFIQNIQDMSIIHRVKLIPWR